MIYYRSIAQLIFVLLIVLAFSFCVSGCKTLDEAPITTLWVIDTDHDVCSEREITNKARLSSVRVREWPLSHCDGVVGLSAKEFKNLQTYIRGEKK